MMTSPRVKDYFLSCDPLRPDLQMNRLTGMSKRELQEVIASQAEMWDMIIPETTAKTKQQLIDLIVMMAAQANKL